MNYRKRLSYVFDNAIRIELNDASRIILMSDCHRGDGSEADEFFRNEHLYLSALNYYDRQRFLYIEIGDGDELWENKNMEDIIVAHTEVFRLLRKLWQEKRLYFIYGNHDLVKREAEYNREHLYCAKLTADSCCESLFDGFTAQEGLVLEYSGAGRGGSRGEILLVHGHQVDFLNSSLWRLSRWLVRHLWKPLELFGITDPTSPAQNRDKKEKIGRRLTDWVIRENRMLIAGHNHRPMFPTPGEPLYFNDGSCVHPLFITGIEIDRGAVALVKWSVKVNTGGGLYVGKDLIGGPTPLKDFFRTKRIFDKCEFRDPAAVSIREKIS